MEEKCIRTTLQKGATKKGIDKYIKIMELFTKVNVSKDEEFQRKYNDFYKIRRNKQFRERYYSIIENSKKDKPSLIKVLDELYKFGNLEVSFASKLLATIDPNLPVWDKYVLENFKISPPSRKLEKIERINQTNGVYESLKNKYKDLLEKDEGKLMIRIFNEYYPNDISSIKKIDFIIWQLR